MTFFAETNLCCPQSAANHYLGSIPQILIFILIQLEIFFTLFLSREFMVILCSSSKSHSGEQPRLRSRQVYSQRFPLTVSHRALAGCRLQRSRQGGVGHGGRCAWGFPCRGPGCEVAGGEGSPSNPSCVGGCCAYASMENSFTSQFCGLVLR